jgi:hypothetical protein
MNVTRLKAKAQRPDESLQPLDATDASERQRRVANARDGWEQF